MLIEILEPRIAPASVLSFSDVDGDSVKIAATRGDLTGAAVFADLGLGEQLQLLDLRDGQFQGASISVVVTKGALGDGLVNIGRIDATGRELGSVVIPGDLGAVDVGDGVDPVALQLLSVRSMGRFGLATQGGSGDLVSNLTGGLGALFVRTDIAGASIDVGGGAHSNIGSIIIGGSLIGGMLAHSGEILCDGDIGPVNIGGDIVGSTGEGSGQIVALGTLGSVSLGGSLIGGVGIDSGALISHGKMGAVTVAHDVRGGSGTASGSISATELARLTIGGSLLGGAGDFSGSIFTTGDIGPVQITHDVVSGSGNESGKLDSGARIARVTIGGSLLGGDGDQDTITDSNGVTHHGQVFAVGSIGPVKISHDVKGGVGRFSGTIASETKLAGVAIGGSLIGGADDQSGSVLSSGAMGMVQIGQDVIGGEGILAGAISADGSLGAVSISGSLIGGRGGSSGAIHGGSGIGIIRITHDVLGGAGFGSGLISTGGELTTLTVGGSVVGGSADESGSILVGDLGVARIEHDLVGGSISAGAPTRSETGAIISLRHIEQVTIGGSIITGTDGSVVGSLIANATIRAGDDIGSLSVVGGLIGNVSETGDSFVIVSARGKASPHATSDVAIGSVSIGDRVEFAQILAGYTTSLDAADGNAQIGSVFVGGDWAASSIVAGATNLGSDDLPGGTGSAADNLTFGDLHDSPVPFDNDSKSSRIGSIVVAGQVFGTASTFGNLVSHFGFVADQIEVVQIGGMSLNLNAAAASDGFHLGRTTNITLHEVGSLIDQAIPGAVAAAVLVNAKTLTYTDTDGDQVTVKLSRPLLNAGNVDDVFKFDIGTVTGGETQGRQLEVVNLAALGSDGLSMTISVKPAGGFADGLANVGFIDSTGFDLGSIVVPGDLGQIEAGSGATGATGLRALTVRTLGRLGLDTQPAPSMAFTPDLRSTINGNLGSATIQADVTLAALVVGGSTGTITIGGSLIGGSGDFSGALLAGQFGGIVKIGAHVQGGTGEGSGEIASGAMTSAVIVGGSFIGGSGAFGGRIVTDGVIGPVTIAHNVLGGTGDSSGRIEGSRLGAIHIGGSMLGGAGAISGGLNSYSDNIGSVEIAHNVRGGTGDDSGKIDCGSRLHSLTIGGSLIGSSGKQNTIVPNGVKHAAQVFTITSLGAVQIGHNLIGGQAAFSGTLNSQDGTGKVTVGGSIIGGSQVDSGGIVSGGRLGLVTIGHNLQGSSGIASGFIECDTAVKGVIVGGSVVGGSNETTGAIFASGELGAVRIGQNLLGGSGTFSGSVQSGGRIPELSIGGSVVGGTAGVTGRVFADSLGRVVIGHDLFGESITGNSESLDSSGLILSAGRIGRVSVGGSVVSGVDDSSNGILLASGSIRAGSNIGALVVHGSLIGNETQNGISPVVISASGQDSPVGGHDVTIGKVSVGGRVERALILVGYSTTVNPFNSEPAAVNGDAEVSRVTVGGDWVASSLVAGAADIDNDGFGNSDDSVVNVIAAGRIAFVHITGVVAGTATPGDHFGFVSPQISFFRSGNFVASQDPTVTPIELSLVTGDLTVLRV